MSIKNIIRPLILILFYFQLSLAQSLIINESMSKNLSSVYDEDGDTPDWIEIYKSLKIKCLTANLIWIFLS